MNPLSIKQILSALVWAISSWSANLAAGAQVTVARDPFHVLELLVQSPVSYLAVVHYAGDDNISDIDAHPLAEYSLEVILSYNLGLTAKPDLALLKAQQNRPSVLEQIDSLRSFILGLQYPTLATGSYPVYGGCKPYVTPDGVPLAAYILTFKLKAAVNVTPVPTPVNPPI